MAKKKSKIPKKIAGVKIPKTLRKQGKGLAAMIDTPTGRALAAEVLMAVAGVLAGTKSGRKAAAHAVDDAADAATDLRDAVGVVGGTIADATRKALSGSGEDESERREAVVSHVGNRPKGVDKPSKH
jgi:hypothetical protein